MATPTISVSGLEAPDRIHQRLDELLVLYQQQSSSLSGGCIEFDSLSWQGDEELHHRVIQLLAHRTFSTCVLKNGQSLRISDWTSITDELVFQQVQLPDARTNPLHFSPQLKSLSLLSISFSEAQVLNLAHHLRSAAGGHCCQLQRLDLTDSRFVGNGVEFLAAGLRDNQSLRIICLSDCHLMDEQLAAVVRSLIPQKSSALRELDICFNKCRTQGVQALTELVRNSSTLGCLRLGYQAYGQGKSIDVDPLLQVLTTNTNLVLQELELSGNSLRDPAMPSIVNLLQRSHTLKTLDLSDNRFTNQGIEMLASRMNEYQRLQKLLMEDNRFDHVALDRLAHGMQRNFALLELETSVDKNEPKGSLDKLSYYLDLNWGGRKLLHDETENLKMGLLPLLMGRVNDEQARQKIDSRNIQREDILYYFLRNCYALV